MSDTLNRSDYLVLSTLHELDMKDQFHGMTIAELMEESQNALGTRMTVYRIASKLVKMGYLATGVLDNHANTYYLLEKGRKLFKEDKAE